MYTDTFKHLIALVSLITMTGLSLILFLWPYGINRTFSQHVARHKAGIVYYILLFLLILPLLLLYVFGWFIPTFRPVELFGVLIVVASICHFACTLVPETGGRKTVVHQMLAYLSADCLLPATFIIMLTPAVSNGGRIIAGFSSILMAIIIAVLIKAYAKNQGEHKYLLVLQGSYFTLFFLTLLVATYTN